MANLSDFESSPEVLGFCKTEQEAKDKVNALVSEYRLVENFYKEINNKRDEFRKENASPTPPKLEDYPRWFGIDQKNITQEMRDERKRIQDRNQMKQDAFSLKFKAYKEKEVEYVMPLFDGRDKDWLEKWFHIGDQHISCYAVNLEENNEYFYEECKSI